MSVSEDRRIALLEAAHHHWGREVAVTLMAMLPPSGWGDVATRQRVDALDHEMNLRFQLVEAKVGALGTTLRAELRADMAEMQHRTIQWIVGTGIAVVGLCAAVTGTIAALVS